MEKKYVLSAAFVGMIFAANGLAMEKDLAETKKMDRLREIFKKNSDFVTVTFKKKMPIGSKFFRFKKDEAYDFRVGGVPMKQLEDIRLDNLGRPQLKCCGSSSWFDLVELHVERGQFIDQCFGFRPVIGDVIKSCTHP